MRRGSMPVKVTLSSSGALPHHSGFGLNETKLPLASNSSTVYGPAPHSGCRSPMYASLKISGGVDRRVQDAAVRNGIVGQAYSPLNVTMAVFGGVALLDRLDLLVAVGRVRVVALVGGAVRLPRRVDGGPVHVGAVVEVRLVGEREGDGGLAVLLADVYSSRYASFFETSPSGDIRRICGMYHAARRRCRRCRRC